jgi:glycosyltransferase involved in cell wall biosynthesis
MPADGGDLLGKLGREGGAWTALRMSSLVSRRFAGLEQFFADVDRFVVLTPWVEQVLLSNHVPAGKLVRSAHGLALPAPASIRRKADGDRLRFIHLGRIDPVKGTDLLIRAFRSAWAADIDLDIYGVVQDDVSGLLDRLQSLAAGDGRIRFLPLIRPSQVIETIASYDVLAVPSQWMETGPLVVLEAFAAGVPVIGSALGGIEGKVTDGVDGLLVRPFDDEAAWASALQRVAADPSLVRRLAANVRPPRSPQSVAKDMRAIYQSLHAPGPVAATEGARRTSAGAR